MVSAVVSVGKMGVVVTTLGKVVATVVTGPVVVAGTDMLVLRFNLAEDVIGLILSSFDCVVAITVCDTVASCVVVSIGFALSSAIVVVVGKLAALVTEVLPEVTKVVSTFGGFVGNTVWVFLSSSLVVSSSVALVSTVVVGKLVVVVKTLGKEVTMVVSTLSGFVDNTVSDVVSSFVVVSTGLTLVSAVVAIGTLVVVVTTLGKVVATVVSGPVVVAGTDMFVLRFTLVDIGLILSTLDCVVATTV